MKSDQIVQFLSPEALSIALVKRDVQINIISYFSMKIYVVGTF